MPTTADVIVARLQDAGVRALFGVPGGGGNLDLIDAARRSALPFVLTATETGAALAAIAQAEVTGRPGACLTTLGPGATSVVNGVACAFLDRVPLLVFTDSHSGGTKSPFEHQRVDHAELLRPVTRGTSVLAAHDAEDLMAGAIARAIGPPPGPVHVECPGPVTAASAGKPRESAADQRMLEEAPDLAPLVPLLAGARKPLLLVGLAARSLDAAQAIRRLCDHVGLPALVTYKAKGVVADDHPWFGGVFTNAEIERPILDESDLLIGVGLDPVELLPRPWKGQAPVVSCAPWRFDTRHVPFVAQHLSEVAAGVGEMAAWLKPSDWRLDSVRRHRAEQRRRLDIPADGLTAQQVVERAAQQCAGRARVTVDAGAHMFAATSLWPVSQPNEMLISNGLSTMGFALPAAIGAALLDRAHPVVALTGDGGLLMCLGELLTAAREQLHVITIVFSDGSLSLIEIKQQARRLAAAGVALGEIGWSAIAEGLGVTPFAATTEQELDAALDRALAASGPSLIAVRIDRSNYAATVRAVRG